LPYRKNFCQGLTFLKKVSLENSGLEGFVSNFLIATASKNNDFLELLVKLN
jgi:hypothetical protein